MQKFINVISVSKQQNTHTAQLQYACVHLQLVVFGTSYKRRKNW